MRGLKTQLENIRKKWEKIIRIERDNDILATLNKHNEDLNIIMTFAIFSAIIIWKRAI